MKIIGPILITGGVGFIGSALVENLLSRGIETHVLDNLSKGNQSLVKKNGKKMKILNFLK